MFRWSLRLLAVAGVAVLLSIPAFSDANPEKGEKKEEEINYKELKNPVAFTEKSIKRGRMLYMRRCTECHGPDGKAQIDVIADATDLTNPVMWLSGTAPGEMFRSIKEGAGVSMPPFKMQIKRDEDMWHMVNFIYSLWPDDKRPELVEVDEAGGDEEDKAEEPSEEEEEGEGA